jgi:hypothetical protein
VSEPVQALVVVDRQRGLLAGPAGRGRRGGADPAPELVASTTDVIFDH